MNYFWKLTLQINKGFSSYLAKYLEYQFRLKPSISTVVMGGIGFFGIIGGIFGNFII